MTPTPRSDTRLLHETVWRYGYILKIRDGGLVAVPRKGTQPLPAEHRAFISAHKQEIIDVLKLTETREGCWICGEPGVAQIEGYYADVSELVSRWHCARHVLNTELRRRVADAAARYRIAQDQDDNAAYHEARRACAVLEVQLDLEEIRA